LRRPDPVKYVDENYSDEATLVEERIVLLRARSFDEAIAKGESEAKLYAKGTYKNLYGQTVKARYMKVCDAFELYDEPGALVEAFSTTNIISKQISDKHVVDRYLGNDESDAERRQRRKFFNAEFWSETMAKKRKKETKA
jgi:hypothetical protein